jgi:hypothetical protein
MTARRNWRARLSTLFVILGPGLIVMVGDNDAGAFGAYTLERVWLIVLRMRLARSPTELRVSGPRIWYHAQVRRPIGPHKQPFHGAPHASCDSIQVVFLR